MVFKLFAILQKYDFSSKSQRMLEDFFAALCCLRYCKSTIFQANHNNISPVISCRPVVCDTAKVRFFKQITTASSKPFLTWLLFAILQKYDFSSKSQRIWGFCHYGSCCLRYCKSTIFQANHNSLLMDNQFSSVVCDTAKVRFFKQITTAWSMGFSRAKLFAILQKYDFSSKSQQLAKREIAASRCLRYCKSTIFQANHNTLFTIVASV